MEGNGRAYNSHFAANSFGCCLWEVPGKVFSKNIEEFLNLKRVENRNKCLV